MRLIKVKAATLKEKNGLEKILRRHGVSSYDINETNDYYVFEILTTEKVTGRITEDLEKVGFGKSFEKGIITLPVQAAIPSPKKKEFAPTIADEEIEADIKQNASTNWIFLSFVGLAAAIIGFGLMSNNFIALMGGMLIAPLLYPMIGSSFFLLKRKPREIANNLRSEAWGLTVPVVVGIILALFLPNLPYTELVLSRGIITLFDVAVAVLAGAAGALSVSTRQLGGFSGVALAVALMPPAVTVGIALGYQDLMLLKGAVLLTLVNVLMIHLASIIVFTVLGYYVTKKDENAKKTAIKNNNLANHKRKKAK